MYRREQEAEAGCSAQEPTRYRGRNQTLSKDADAMLERSFRDKVHAQTAAIMWCDAVPTLRRRGAYRSRGAGTDEVNGRG